MLMMYMELLRTPIEIFKKIKFHVDMLPSL